MNHFPNRETVERLRRDYPAGCRIVCDVLDDPYVSIPAGSQATVWGVDDAGSLLCSWDMGSSLNVCYGADSAHKIATEAEAKITLDWWGKHQPETDCTCPRCGAPMPGKTLHHALSRRADIYICDADGMNEALEDAGLAEKKPLMQWYAIQQAQNGGGKWNG